MTANYVQNGRQTGTNQELLVNHIKNTLQEWIEIYFLYNNGLATAVGCCVSTYRQSITLIAGLKNIPAGEYSCRDEKGPILHNKQLKHGFVLTGKYENLNKLIFHFAFTA